MRNRFSSMFVVSLLLAGGSLGGATESAQEMARKTLAALRTEKDRTLTTLVVPEGNDRAERPEGAEVYLIRVYINYTCVRIFTREGKLVAQRVKMARSWFYSPKEGYSTEEWEIPKQDFAQAWEAVRLIGAASMPRNEPPKQEKGRSGWSSTSGFSMMSHEPMYYVRVWSDAKLYWEDATRGMTSSNGVQYFPAMQTQAIETVLENLVPKEETGQAFPLVTWGPFLTQQLTANKAQLQPAPLRLNSETALLLETSLRLLGQMGYVPAREPIRTLEENARRAPPKATWAEKVLRETGYALGKIAVQEKFDADEVDSMIHAYGRRINPDRDMVQWLRDQYFVQDPKGYFSLVAKDLVEAKTSEEILLESVAEVHKRYPDKAAPLLTGVLNSASSEVAAKAALALLQADPDHEAALQTLTRLAGDAQASIPVGIHWSSYFGRERALDYLASERSPVPQAYRWDSARIEQQLSLPWEDGRMVNRLISMWEILNNKQMSDERKIEAYRKVLAPPYNMGTVDACSELITLKDQESASRIAEVLRELRAGCNKGLAWEEDAEAKYPWVSRFDLERVEEALKKMLPRRSHNEYEGAI